MHDVLPIFFKNHVLLLLFFFGEQSEQDCIRGTYLQFGYMMCIFGKCK